MTTGTAVIDDLFSTNFFTGFLFSALTFTGRLAWNDSASCKMSHAFKLGTDAFQRSVINWVGSEEQANEACSDNQRDYLLGWMESMLSEQRHVCGAATPSCDRPMSRFSMNG